MAKMTFYVPADMRDELPFPDADPYDVDFSSSKITAYWDDNYQDKTVFYGSFKISHGTLRGTITGIEHYWNGGVEQFSFSGLKLNINQLDTFSGEDILKYNDTITGSYGADYLESFAGNDKLYGNAGNDTLDGGTGNDYMAGGTGNDIYFVDSASDVVVEDLNAGTDKVNAYINYILGANTENLYLYGTATNGNGNALDNVISGNSKDNTLYGDAGNDTLDGSIGNDKLYGGNGNDTLDGGTGNDYMAGGTGNDIYFVDSASDVVVEDLNAGTDKVNAYINYTLGVNVENLYLSGAATNGNGNALDNVISGDSNDNTLYGDEGNDTLDGSIGNDMLYGGNGDDILDGGTGDDSMYGGAGDDTYIVDFLSNDVVIETVGAGTDRVNAYMHYTLPANVENLYLYGNIAATGNGNALDNVIFGNGSDNTLSGFDGNDTLDGLDGGDYLYGGNGSDTLNGGNGGDWLDGNAGNDRMYGGAGDDLYSVDSAADVVSEAAGAGDDEVWASVSYTLGANIEDLYLWYMASTGTGNSLDNSILSYSSDSSLYGLAGKDYLSGNLGNDYLNGGVGNDTLNGSNGNDTLDGGTGNDYMAGGTGNDIYFVDNAADVVSEALDEGTDRVNSTVSVTLNVNVENLYLYGTATTGTGNDLDNWIVGNGHANLLYGLAGNDRLYGFDGNDYLYGGTGDDTLYGGTGNGTFDGGLGNDNMYGGTGNDTYVIDSVGDLVVEAVGAGTDRINAYVSDTLNVNVENLYLYGTASTGTGNDLDNWIVGNGHANLLYGLAGNDRLYGFDGNDYLYGGTGDDTLYGGTGNGTFDGGLGNDNMYGGTGNDTYVIDSVGDLVVEAVGAGTDRINAYVSDTLNVNVENLYLYGTASTGTGNDLDNWIVGNGHANLLYGLAGNDRLYGFDGNDYLYGGTGDDTLYGGTGNGTFDGGLGNDTMYGGTGNDTYVIDSVGDLVVEAMGAGTDRINAYVSDTLNVNVENLYLYGTATTGTGNDLDNWIVGNGHANLLYGLAGNDRLYGFDGNDTLNGGLGNDILTGGSGADCFDFTTALNAATNKDTITDFSVVDDTIRLENGIMTGLGTATGVLAVGAFHSGALNTATEADDRVIYNTSTGALFYDADGTGSTAEVQLAIIGSTTHPALTNADFMVI